MSPAQEAHQIVGWHDEDAAYGRDLLKRRGGAADWELFGALALAIEVLRLIPTANESGPLMGVEDGVGSPVTAAFDSSVSHVPALAVATSMDMPAGADFLL